MNNISPFTTKKGKKKVMKVYSQRITFFNLLTYNVETDQSVYLARPQCDMNNSYRSLTKGCMHDFLLQK
jgi:hypothetical protein